MNTAAFHMTTAIHHILKTANKLTNIMCHEKISYYLDYPVYDCFR